MLARRVLLSALSVALVATCAAITGCKESDAIVERIQDQNSENIDVDNPDKLWVPDEKSELKAKDFDIDLDDVLNKDQIKEDTPDKDDEDKDKEKDSSEHTDTRNSGTSSQATSGGDYKRTDGTGGSGEATSKSKKGDGGNANSKGKGSSEDLGSETGSHSVDMDNDDFKSRTYDATYGNTKNLPTNVKTIAAVGELATMAMVLGGEGTLVGSSKEYLSRSSVKEVFSKKGIDKAKSIWSTDYEKTTGKECDKIIDLNPDACVVFSGQLSAKQERVIAQNCPDMKVITLPRPTSAENIKTDLKALAQLLSESTNGNSTKIANDYIDFEKEVVKEAKDAHGGGVVTYNAVDYSSTDSTRIVTVDNPSSQQKWSLYISGWDSDAKAKATYQGTTIFTDTGAAYTYTGWTWSPLSYYMSVGGVINNAAAYGPLSTETLQPVLCFNENQVAYKWSNFCVKTNENRGGGSYTGLRGFYVLTNARDGVDESGTNPDAVHALGSDDFNTVIVKTSSIKSALTKACKEKDGLYTLYGKTSTVTVSGYGRKFSGKTGQSIIYNTVKGDAGYEIKVNPCGYVGSWTDGSMESPLESLWIANQYWGYDSSSLKKRIKEFYEEFYDYTPDVDKILNGSFAE